MGRHQLCVFCFIWLVFSMSLVKEGYLIKQSLYLRQERKRWIVLNHGFMDCYKDNVSLDATEIFDLSKFDDVRPTQNGKTGQFELISHETNRIFIASSTEEMEKWIVKIKQCMVQSDEHKDTNTKTIMPTIDCSKPDILSSTCAESDIENVSAWYSSELQTLRTKHAMEKNELDAQQQDDEMEGKIDPLNSTQRGLLIFQKDTIKNKQLLTIQTQFQSEIACAPKILCERKKYSKFKQLRLEIDTKFKALSQLDAFKNMT